MILLFRTCYSFKTKKEACKNSSSGLPSRSLTTALDTDLCKSGLIPCTADCNCIIIYSEHILYETR